MSNNKECWIIEDPLAEGVRYYFEHEAKEYAEWFLKCRTVSRMFKGSQPTDGGNFFMTEDEAKEAVKSEPNIAKYIRQCCGSYEFINNIKRFCLWLVNAEPEDIKKSKFIYERIKKVKEFRLASKSAATRKSAEKPYLFQHVKQPTTDYILIPSVSSERRRYIPIGYVSPDVIVTNLAFSLENATLYHFGILTSSVHMGWMRRVCGRLEISYRYSNTIVYNCFVWPAADPRAVARIFNTAKAILDVRAKFPQSSLASLYDENSMPIELRKAHEENDKAVMNAYKFPQNLTEDEIADRLFDMYNVMIEKEKAKKAGLESNLPL